jgi:hypothetical protein
MLHLIWKVFAPPALPLPQTARKKIIHLLALARGMGKGGFQTSAKAIFLLINLGRHRHPSLAEVQSWDNLLEE